MEPAQPTVPVVLGLWVLRSSRIRFCSPPAQHRADTLQEDQEKEEKKCDVLLVLLLQHLQQSANLQMSLSAVWNCKLNHSERKTGGQVEN